MDDNIEEPLPIRDLAKELDIDQKQLQRKFLQEFGANPSQVYRHKRLNFARLQILGSNLPMSEIAVRCGYENASAMARAFKSEFSITPTSLRR
jgi:transcriptional regulator GlxA family with amidase domain